MRYKKGKYMRHSRVIKLSIVTILAISTLGSTSVCADDIISRPVITQEKPNPGLDAQVNVVPKINVQPGATYKLQTLPLHGTLYYRGEAITSTDMEIHNVNDVTVDPEDGAVTVTFSYVKTDAEGNTSKPRQVILRFSDIHLSGHVFHDFDGNGIVDGDSISKVDTLPLYVTLVNKDNEFVASKEVLPEGSFSFSGSDGVQPYSNYALIVSTEKNSFASKLPDTWGHSGENINSLRKGKDSHKDGIVVVTVRNKDVNDIDFGLDIRPLAKNETRAAQLNPGGNTQVPVPPLEGSDKENGEHIRFVLATLPDNATLYENGKKIEKRAEEIKQPGKLTIDPDDGNQTVVFSYVTADKVGVLSHTATVTMPFDGLTISGKVLNDGNGKDTVEGKPLSHINDATLYVNLLDEKNHLLDSQEVGEDGAYMFNGKSGIKPDTAYSLVLSTQQEGRKASLPQGWNYASASVEGKTKGKHGLIKIDVHKNNVHEVNFGINEKPLAFEQHIPSQLNPGSDIKIPVPTLKGEDRESDATVLRYTISTLPKHARLYDGEKQIDKAGYLLSNPSALMIDPDDGDNVNTFSYQVTDEDNISSDPQMITMAFSGLVLSGHVRDDGIADNNVSGPTLYNADHASLYMLLLDSNKVLLHAKKIESDGTFHFNGKEGVKPDSTYVLALARGEKIKDYGLPKGWYYNGTQIDGMPLKEKGKDKGVIVVNVSNKNIANIDFGINKQPQADIKETEAQLNPGKESQVAVPTLSGNDRESGTNLVYKVSSLPTTGTLYNNAEKISRINTIIEDPSLLTLDPDNGDNIVLFSYVTEDEAGVASDPARVKMSFKGLTIAGRIVNKGNGDQKGRGKAIRIPKRLKPYATLLDVNGTILASNPINRDGKFSFNGKDGVYPNATFSIVASLEANATSATLPKSWFESKSLSKTEDNSSDTSGKMTIRLREKSINSLEFGVNQAPKADSKSVKAQINPGAHTKVKVPRLSGNDRENGTALQYMVTKVPDNAILYTKNKVVSNNDMVTPDDLSLDPKDGTQTVTFEYVTVDAEKILSKPAVVTMTFTGLNISGSIFEDFIRDGVVDSANTVADEKLNLFVTLLNEKGEVVASVPVDKKGTYTFNASTGVNANTKYRLILAKDANVTTSVLPDGWHYADGENVNSLSKGTDGKADGMIDVTVKDIDLKQVDFGINNFLE